MRSIVDNPLDIMFRDFNRFTVGFEPTLRMLDKARSSINDGYPPYDLEQLGPEKYRLSMAVAGFKADDIDITIQNGTLDITGNTSKDDKDKTYLHKGIASRSFKRTFYLNAYLKVTKSELIDGILAIDFEQELPDTMKPKKIPINLQLSSST